MNYFFSVAPLLFSAVFLLVFGLVVYTFIRNIKQDRENDQSPRLTVEAKVVSKRSSLHMTTTEMRIPHGKTTYFVTFEVKSGDRMELQVQGHEYGMLVEGDFGELTFQGIRYLSFARRVNYA